MEGEVHGSLCDDAELLSQLVKQCLASRGVPTVLATPRPAKKGLVGTFSTPATRHASAADTPARNKLYKGKLFGRKLIELGQTQVALEGIQGDQGAVIGVPSFVVAAANYIEQHAEIEGIYRVGGSQDRLKKLRTALEERPLELIELSPQPHVVASLLKQFLRELPEPLIPRIFHPLLENCYNSEQPLENLQLALLLLPMEHMSCLTFLLQHLARVAAKSNKMDCANLAIVISPNLFSLEMQAKQGGKEGKNHQVTVNQVKLHNLHSDIVEMLIENSKVMGYITKEISEDYIQCLAISAQSHSEGELLEEEGGGGPARRKGKKTRVRKRSGSLSRVLSVVGKAMGLGKATPGTKDTSTSVHSTPLPVFGGTPAYPSPRVRATHAKRNAEEDHDQSPSKKLQRRALESTFTPKMRKRSFSVKRFKRKKSETKMKPAKETLIEAAKWIRAMDISKDLSIGSGRSEVSPSPPVTRHALAGTTGTPHRLRLLTQESTDGAESEEVTPMEEQYAEVKAQYEELKTEVGLLEASQSVPEGLDEAYNAAMSQGTLTREPQETRRQIARVRRSMEDAGKKPRSPSQRRIGVIRRRSREREERLAREEKKEVRRRSRDPTPKSDEGPRGGPSPRCKAALTPALQMLDTEQEQRERPLRSGSVRLQRGQPNSTSVGLERPQASPVLGEAGDVTGGLGGLGVHQPAKLRIKMSFKGKETPGAKREPRPLKATRSPMDGEKEPSHSGESLVNLQADISHLIEKSFGEKILDDDVLSGDRIELGMDLGDIPSCKMDLARRAVYQEKTEESDMCTKLENISFKNGDSPGPKEGVDLGLSRDGDQQGDQMDLDVEDLFSQTSPVTRAQLRRQSESFQFARPADVDQPDESTRRQSSAFEFQSMEPTYENLSRGTFSRASIRRRNSSVKDLIQRLEAGKPKPKEVVDILRAGKNAKVNAIPRVSPSQSVVNEKESTIIKQKTGLESSRAKPVINIEPLRIPEGEEEMQQEGWVDGATFFKNIKELNVPQCGRSSIVKIREDIRGRVQDSVSKFSSAGDVNTPLRPVGSSRRLSARMGVTPHSLRLGVQPSPLVTPLGLASGRRTLPSGIRTTATGRPSTGRPAGPSNSYKGSTLASTAKAAEASPACEKPPQRKSPAVTGVTVMPATLKTRRSPSLSVPRSPGYAAPTISSLRKSPNYATSAAAAMRRSPSRVAATSKKSPNITLTVPKQVTRRVSPLAQGRRSTGQPEPSYENINVGKRVERKSSNSRDTERKPSSLREVDRKPSNSRDIRRLSVATGVKEKSKGKVRRIKSNQEKSSRRAPKRTEERRYLTIGYPGEVGEVEVRSPLRETQNLLLASNVKRSNSDQTPSRGKTRGKVITRAGLGEQENILELSARVGRASSLKSDTMSPLKWMEGTPNSRVTRAQSDRSGTPSRHIPFSRAEPVRILGGDIPTRKSPRFANF